MSDITQNTANTLEVILRDDGLARNRALEIIGNMTL
jgi:hypothetical protein